MDVTLAWYDRDLHGEGCDCGLCDSVGHSYGVSITEVGKEDPIDVIYAPSENGAMHNALMECQRHSDWKVVEVIS